jgi:DNA polymerase III subunit gamma/tau
MPRAIRSDPESGRAAADSFRPDRYSFAGTSMSYLVLARKYRPQTFDEVVGQEHVTRTLANAFSQGRVHHAFLFCGPRGVGKTTAARILGKALNCEGGPTAAPCGTCGACASITDGSSVDYFEMDGASNRGIDSIRELTEAVRYQPAVLRKKVYVIDEVHMLTTEAFNALLKTLEEPPPHVTFVLATTEPHKVPNTILSRCQRYDFKLVGSSRLAAHLQRIFAAESIEAAPGAVSLVVRESGGSVRDALSLCDQIISYVGEAPLSESKVAEVLGVADRALTRRLVTSLAGGDAATALEVADEAIGRGVDEVQLTRALVSFLRDVAVLQAAPGSERLVDGSAEERAELSELAGGIEPGRVRLMFERVLRAADDLAETREPRLVLDLALIELAAIEPLVPLGDLVERLSDLERRLGAGGAAGSSSAPPRGTAGRSAGGRSAGGRSAGPSAAPSGGTVPVPVPVPVPEPEPVSSSGPGAAPGKPRGVPADPLVAWEEVVGALEQSRALTLVSLYRQARVLSWDERGVELAFPAGNATSELAAEPDKVEAIQEHLRSLWGAPLVVKVVTLPGDQLTGRGKSIVEADQERRDDEEARRASEAREHPATRMVLDAFGARIEEIKTDV